MTTLIQSELDDLLRESTKFGASAFCRLKAVEKLRDHIAQLTAERDEAIADNDDCHIEIAGKDARIAALEAERMEERLELRAAHMRGDANYRRLSDAHGRIDALEAQLTEHDAALTTAIKVAGEAAREWDAAPNGMKAGKLLIALSDPTLRYRADITAMHAARARSEQEGK